MPGRITDEVRKLAIGQKIRTLRESQGLSLGQLAERTRMPEVLLSQIESDVIAPTVAALVNIAGVLGATVDSFFQDAPFTENVEVVRHGEGRKIRRIRRAHDTPLSYNYESLAYRLEGKHMEPFLVEFLVDVDDHVEPLSHDGEEFIFILEGEVEFTSGDQRIVLRAGDSIYFQSKTPHSLRGIGTEAPRAIAVLYPYPD